MNMLSVLENYIVNMHAKTDNFFFTETWFICTTPDSLLFCPLGYSCLCYDHVSGRGGILIVYCNRMNITQVFPPTMLDCVEFALIDISSDREKCKARFVCLYLSPNAATKVENIEQVCKMLTFCVSVNFPTLIFGDFNLP